jgi:integron integrase
MAKLLYGCGLRLQECLQLRVKDIDFEKREILVRAGKGDKDRVTMLPDAVVPFLQDHLRHVKQLHQRDLARGYGRVDLPFALESKYPNAGREWSWQYVFPLSKLSRHPQTGLLCRRHLHESTLQKAARRAAQQAGLSKRVICHTSRHCFATHLLENSYDVRTVQELLGHKDVRTTMIHTDVLNRGALAVRSPLD